MLNTWMEDFIGAAGGYGVEGIVVLQHGKELGRFHWLPEKRRNLYSVSKSFTSCAVGLAIREGLIGGLDDLVLDYFPDKAPEHPCPELQKLTLRHLITMSVGQDGACLMGESREALREEEPDWVKYALSRPFSEAPGSRFLYTNVGPYLLGKIVQRQSGQNLVDYLMPRLFGPLGIEAPQWELDPEGEVFGAGGLCLNVTELARFCQLYLQKGKWEGRQLVPENWVELSGAKQIETVCRECEDGLPGADSADGYGYLFWCCPGNAYRAAGKYGQFGIILPDYDAVIAIHSQSQSSRAQEILDCVWERLLPKMVSRTEPEEDKFDGFQNAEAGSTTIV